MTITTKIISVALTLLIALSSLFVFSGNVFADDSKTYDELLKQVEILTKKLERICTTVWNSEMTDDNKHLIEDAGICDKVFNYKTQKAGTAGWCYRLFTLADEAIAEMDKGNEDQANKIIDKIEVIIGYDMPLIEKCY